MKHMKRIFALTGAVLLAMLYAVTLIFALIDSPSARALLKASVAATVLIPVLLYSYTLVYRLMRKKDTDKEENSEDKK